MRLQIVQTPDGGQAAIVTLSLRNVLALAHKIQWDGSRRTLVTEFDCPDGWLLVVRGEDDEEHYGGRSEPPGPMHPVTEGFISGATPSSGPASQDQQPNPVTNRGLSQSRTQNGRPSQQSRCVFWRTS
jgi:hypothetical protein